MKRGPLYYAGVPVSVIPVEERDGHHLSREPERLTRFVLNSNLNGFTKTYPLKPIAVTRMLNTLGGFSFLPEDAHFVIDVGLKEEMSTLTINLPDTVKDEKELLSIVAAFEKEVERAQA